MSVDEMRQQLEQLEAEEEEIDVELGKLIKQQPDLLIKGMTSLLYSLNMKFLYSLFERPTVPIEPIQSRISLFRGQNNSFNF